MYRIAGVALVSGMGWMSARAQELETVPSLRRRRYRSTTAMRARTLHPASAAAST
jgi:hypothetical protein